MAKAQFHRGQRVWVDSVGAWAVVERLSPTWAKGFDEPVRIGYDVGLGREFQGQELRAESTETSVAHSGWRLLRARNKWQSADDCAHHPLPGTFPVVVTDPNDWGGWRTPGAEYDRDPQRIERQARLIAAAPRLLDLARALHEAVSEMADDTSADLQALARHARGVLRDVTGEPGAPASPPSAGSAAQEERAA